MLDEVKWPKENKNNENEKLKSKERNNELLNYEL